MVNSTLKTSRKFRFYFIKDEVKRALEEQEMVITKQS